ncbi:MAG: hotdog fold domain-containing protein [Desulfobacterales bacterium]
MDNDEKQAAIEAIENHFATLSVGQSSRQEKIYSEGMAHEYAGKFDIPYPGVYVTAEGELLVPPGMIFMRPAVTFGISDPDAPPLSKGGIFTQTHRKYLKPVRVGQPVTFDGHIIDLYRRRGFYYLAVRWEARDEDGSILAAGDEWHTLGFLRVPSD